MNEDIRVLLDALQKAKKAWFRDEKILEKLAALEHEQWVQWSRAVAHEVLPERRARWERYWVPYDELSEEVKEQDRVWARKVLQIIGKEEAT